MKSSAFRPRRRDTPELNVISMVDVVLLLLIFFMLSTTFNHSTELKIELPEVSAATENKSLNVIDLSIDKDGHYFVDKQVVTDTSVENLAQVLQQAIKGRQDLTVQLNADARTPHQAVITAMDAARRVGLLRFAFIAIPEPAAID